jgi:hypothetical protein
MVPPVFIPLGGFFLLRFRQTDDEEESSPPVNEADKFGAKLEAPLPEPARQAAIRMIEPIKVGNVLKCAFLASVATTLQLVSNCLLGLFNHPCIRCHYFRLARDHNLLPQRW